MKNFPSPEEILAGTVILIDKPLTWTSFDALNKFRRYVKTKIGHAGTLDPLATGLLICCTGKMTKQITNYQQQAKEYTGIICLGATTPTYDLESEPQDFKPYDQLNESEINAATVPFTGAIAQIPPIHSAIKKDGVKAYDLARKGIEVKMEPRQVTIMEFQITKIELPDVHFRVACSTGTYIRSLANDFGAALGCGGYLKSLRRTKIGNFSVEDAPGMEEWAQYFATLNEGAPKI